MKLSEWLINYRREHKLSMQDVADKCGFSKTYVYMLEKGINNKTGKAISPTIQTLTKIAEMSGMTVDELIVILDDDQPVVVNEQTPPDKEEKPLTAREFMRIICKGDKEALAIVERLKLTQDGDLEITGADMLSSALLNLQIQNVVAALKKANITDDGMAAFEVTPRKEG